VRTSDLIAKLQAVVAEHGDVPVVIYTNRAAPSTNSSPNTIVTPGHVSPYYHMLPDFVYGLPDEAKGEVSQPVLFLGDLYDSDLAWNRRVYAERAKEKQ
jgi:hypothetical protein